MSQLIVLILCGMQIYHFKQHLSDYLVIVLLVQILLVIFKLQHLVLVVLHFVEYDLFFIFQQFAFLEVCCLDVQLAA